MTPELANALEQLHRVPKQTLVEVVPGFSVRRKANGITVGRIHYSADPDRDPTTPQGKEWYDTKRLEYDSNKAGWEREYEIVDEAGGGERIFADILTRYGQAIIIRNTDWKPNPDWDVVGGFDHGGTNPTCLLKCYIDTDGNKYFAGEFYRYKTKDWDNTISSNARAITGMEKDENGVLVPAKILGTNKELIGYIEPMPDLKRMRWINGDPSIFWDTVPTPEGQLVAAASIYKSLGLSMRSFDGERSDLAFVQRLQDDLWGSLHSRAPKVYIVCRNESDARQPGLHPYDCPNLLWEVKRIRRAELTAKQLMTQNQTEKIVDKNNHAWDPCFVAGTAITTRRGPVPIESVMVGEDVLTRDGWMSAAEAGQTSAEAEIWKLTLQDGRTILGTANHPVYVNGEFLRLEELKYGMMCLCEKQSTVLRRLLRGWASISTVIQRAKYRTSAAISEMGACISTRWCGSLRTASPSHMGTISITSMATRSTALTRLTSRPYQPWNIFADTLNPSATSPTFRPIKTRHVRGILPPMVRRGIVQALGRLSLLRSKRLVASVESPSAISFGRRGTASAEELAEHSGGTPTTSTMRPATADTARIPLSASSTPRPSSALELVPVLSVEKTPLRLPVYNLSVAGKPEYFANGILVHNCKYICMQFPKAAELPPAKKLENLIKDLNPMSAQIAAERFISRLGKSSKVGRFDIRNKGRMGR